MRKVLFLAVAFATMTTAAIAQQGVGATAVGVGTGISSSRSAAGAISGSNSAINISSPSATSSDNRMSGTTTLRNVPSVTAPGLAAAGLETCLGSVSGGAAGAGFGFSFGSTVTDGGCDTRLDARTLWSFGLKNEAIARLCAKTEIANAMPARCGRPVAAPAVAAYVPALVATSGTVTVVSRRTGQSYQCADWNGSRCLRRVASN
jgi:hypothetical protein